VIAGFQGVVASPVSAATAAMIGILAARDVSLPRILAITIPSTLIAVVIGALTVAWRGKNLAEDEEYQKRLASGTVKLPEPLPELTGSALLNARGSTLLFLAGIAGVVLIGIVPSLRPSYQVIVNGQVDTDQIEMGRAIMIVMIAIAGLIMIFFKASPETALKGAIMRSGVTAVISILGVSWLGSSFFEGNRQEIVGGISRMIEVYPWTFAIGLFLMSTMLFSAAATVSILMPVGLALDVPAGMLIAFYAAANGVFFLPTYGTLLAAVSFDQTGTTRIGKYLLNHSFMLPGLVTTISSVLLGLAINSVLPQ
jgi:anaerobic C4-dicarboxylate transporter DcuA